MSNDPQVSPREFSEAIQDLRDEIRRDVRGLSSTIDRRPKPKPGVSPLGVVASVLASLFVGAAGMSLYEGNSATTDESAAPPVNVQEEVRTALAPHTQQFVQAMQSLTATEQAASEDLKAHSLLLDDLAKQVDNLRRSAEIQNTNFHERIDLLADELATKVIRGTDGSSEPTVAARQPIPDREDAAVQPANAETEVTDTTEASPQPKTQPVTPAADEPERGELVINNPSEYDLKLLINGKPMDIKASGVTTIDVTVGTVKTQIGRFPQTAKTWDNWQTVDGAKRLTINVEASGGYYKLR